MLLNFIKTKCINKDTLIRIKLTKKQQKKYVNYRLFNFLFYNMYYVELSFNRKVNKNYLIQNFSKDSLKQTKKHIKYNNMKYKKYNLQFIILYTCIDFLNIENYIMFIKYISKHIPFIHLIIYNYTNSINLTWYSIVGNFGSEEEYKKFIVTAEFGKYEHIINKIKECKFNNIIKLKCVIYLLDDIKNSNYRLLRNKTEKEINYKIDYLTDVKIKLTEVCNLLKYSFIFYLTR
jgi:hypothetical protein